MIKQLTYNPYGLSQNLIDTIKDELNVKKLTFESRLDAFGTPIIKINYKACGRKYGKDIKLLEEVVRELNSEYELGRPCGSYHELFQDINFRFAIRKYEKLYC